MRRSQHPTEDLLLRWLVLAFVLISLRSDFWFWRTKELVMGIPVSLLYHLTYSILLSGVFYLAVTHWWPTELRDMEIDDDE